MLTILSATRKGARAVLTGLASALAVTVGAAHAQTPTVTPVPGQPLLFIGAYDPTKLGQTVEEFFIGGQATSYKLPGAPTTDGRWNVSPAQTAPYKTRVVVIRPSDPAKFNGTVVVEWLNVSGGADVGADWQAAHRLMMRDGYAWVGVSAQKVGVEGGPSLGAMGAVPLKKADPKRYGDLSHPGDAFSYDIFSQAGRAIRSDAVLGPLKPKHVVAVGESQSATFLTTYVNAVDRVAKVYDGFLIHSRFGPAPRLDGAPMIGGPPSNVIKGVKFRTDLRVPLITVITESDLIGGRLQGYIAAQQPDNAKLRVWEIPGASHADTFTVQAAFIDVPGTPIEKIAAAAEPTDKFFGTQLAKPMNSGPQHHYVVESALWHLNRWVDTGTAPPTAARLQLVTADPPTLALDANGNAKGGVRNPWVDVPTARLSGVGNSGGELGQLLGVTEAFDAAKLAQLYPGGKRDYLSKFQASLDQAIAAGFILADDRQQALDLAGLMWKGAP